MATGTEIHRGRRIVMLVVCGIFHINVASSRSISDNITDHIAYDDINDLVKHLEHEHLDYHDDYSDDFEYSEDEVTDYESVYESIRDEIPELLTEVERKYKTHIQHQHGESPLLSLVTREPHTMTIMMQPMKMEPNTKVRLLYERVPAHRKPNITHLDRPVMDFVPIIRDSQTYVIDNLPRGKYIVCGEAMNHSEDVFQESCFETKIHREETEDLQIGVKAIIVIAITIVIFVVLYNIIYQICRSRQVIKKKDKAKTGH